ncbi:MAG: hypothetical protein V1781_00775 [Bacteroidota bacterium]
MKKTVYYILAFTCNVLLFTHVLRGQNIFSSEEDLKKQANKLFEEEEFTKAYPLFSQLLSLYSKDAQYNYKFGTCLLYSASNKEKAIPYLEYAAKRQKQNVDKEVFFYLGKAYHLNYRFADAINGYNKYKKIASSRQQEKYDVNRQIEMCANGKKLLKNITELSVLEKKEMTDADFFRSYNLTEFNSKLIVKPEDLLTSVDKKKKEQNIMYLAPNRNQIYFSSYGDDDKNGKDIFYVNRLPNGDLSKPIRLNATINTKYDEDFPFFHPNGTTLYFCSKGHNSMGGYDVFKSEWNGKDWGKPVNMDFAINTPDDDILFVSDSTDHTAYFSSRREGTQGTITVYKILLERKPLNIAIIKGILVKKVGDEVPAAKITITDISKNEVVTVANSNNKDGSYSLTLPNGGKFMFAVESEGFKKSSELVVVPPQLELKPLKQQISLINENERDKIIIANNFEADIDSTDLLFALNFIKEKSLLEVNTIEEENTEITAMDVSSKTSVKTKPTTKNKTPVEKTLPEENVMPEENVVKENTEITAVDVSPKTSAATKTPVSSVTNSDIIEMAYQDSKETQKDANELRKNANAAETYVKIKNEDAMAKHKEAEDILKNAEDITNQEEKNQQIDKANKLSKEEEQFSKEAAMSLVVSSQLNEQAKAKQEQADVELKFAKDFETAIKSNASEEYINKLLAKKEELQKQSETLKNADDFAEALNKQAEEAQTTADKTMTKYLNAIQDVSDMQKETKRLRTEAEKQKKSTVKTSMIQQAEEMEKEIPIKQKEAETLNIQAKQLQAKADTIITQSAIATSVVKGTPLPSSIIASTEGTVNNETSATATVLAYSDVFAKQLNDVESKTKNIEKEEAKANIYQSWADSIDTQIVSLKTQSSSTANKTEKKQIQNKISELQLTAKDKRQKAADSRNKVDNLKLQETLAASSTTQTTASSSVPPENIIGTKNINSYYENKLSESANTTNEYEQKTKEQKVYDDWASSLQAESQRLKKEGSKKKAADVEKESKTKQLLAIESWEKATEIKKEHPELAAVSSPTEKTTTTTVSASETIKNKDKYEHYTALKKEADLAMNNAKRQQNQADEYQELANSQFKESQQLSAKSNTTTDPAERTKLIKESEALDQQMLRNQSKSDSLKFIAKNTESESNFKSIEAELYLQSLDKQAYEEITSATKTNIKETENKEKKETSQNIAPSQAQNTAPVQTQNTAPAQAQSTVPSQVQSAAPSQTQNTTPILSNYFYSIFDRLEIDVTSAYSSSKPIPVDPPMPDGLIFKVQIGAFRNAIPQDLFKGLKPIMAETTPMGFKRYTAGLFIKFGMANTAKNQVHNLGYRDAFIVAFFNGKRISMSEALTKARNAGENVDYILASAQTQNITTPVKTQTVATLQSAISSAQMQNITSTVQTQSIASLPAGTSVIAATTNVKNVSGLFYTVQIGVFSKEVSAAQLYNISPLNSEHTDNGLFRYTTGRFNDDSKAEILKNSIVTRGIKDAFVTAYYQGKRISLSAAKNLIASGQEVLMKETQTYTPASSSSTVLSSSGIIFKIQIGAFREQVSIDIVNTFLGIAGMGIKNYKDENGLTVFTVGEFSDYVSASKLKDELILKGLSDAFVAAYKDGKKISMNEAIK